MKILCNNNKERTGKQPRQILLVHLKTVVSGHSYALQGFYALSAASACKRSLWPTGSLAVSLGSFLSFCLEIWILRPGICCSTCSKYIQLEHDRVGNLKMLHITLTRYLYSLWYFKRETIAHFLNNIWQLAKCKCHKNLLPQLHPLLTIVIHFVLVFQTAP